jgi:glycine/D-amino acid oxidase-like deaminating enzyme
MHVPNAFHIHPLNYTLGLAAAAETAGARIFEETPATAIDPAGVRKRIDTPQGRLRADTVVLAGNVHLGALMPQIAETLIPISTFVLVTEPIANLSDVIRWRGAVSDGDRADNHYRIVGGNRLQWSGRLRVWEAEPRRFVRGLLGDIKRNFPALDNVEAASVWRGTLGRTVHRMPQVGELERGLWLASGFGGHGLNTTAMAGELVARGILDADQTWRLFAPYELVWAGGRLGRTLAQTAYWVRAAHDTAAQALSRRREKRRERVAPATA